MIVQHNMSAANANRQLGINATNLSKSTEKLSSGYRINRAGDDAAGLTISEKMRSQIRGLDQASTNAQDGISLIQTAEGALDETHNILQRMRELSVQGANDTNTDEEREAITKEMDQLTAEINRIAENTQYNKKNLLDGTFDGKLQIGANATQTLGISIGKMDSASLGLSSGAKIALDVDAKGLQEGTYKLEGTNVKDAKGNTIGQYDNANKKITLSAGTTTEIALGHELTDGSTIKVVGGKITEATFKPTDNTASSKLAAGEYQVQGQNVLLGDKLVGKLQAAGKADKLDITVNGKTETIDLTTLGLADGDVANGKTFTIKGVDVSSADKASGSLNTIDEAIKRVSSQRSTLGALQNRLEHTISNLDNSSENLQSAESRIRDVDMAKEMVKFSKSNILQQASQSMLAQAKNSTQGVLSLLQ